MNINKGNFLWIIPLNDIDKDIYPFADMLYVWMICPGFSNSFWCTSLSLSLSLSLVCDFGLTSAFIFLKYYYYYIEISSQEFAQFIFYG